MQTRGVKKDKLPFHFVGNEILYLIIKGQNIHKIYCNETTSNHLPLAFCPHEQQQERGD